MAGVDAAGRKERDPESATAEATLSSAEAGEGSGEEGVDESKLSPVELLRHRRQTTGGEAAGPHDSDFGELLAEAELMLATGKTVEEVAELLQRSRVLGQAHAGENEDDAPETGEMEPDGCESS